MIVVRSFSDLRYNFLLSSQLTHTLSVFPPCTSLERACNVRAVVGFIDLSVTDFSPFFGLLLPPESELLKSFFLVLPFDIRNK